ncbi:MAG: M13 family metallopeptidase [Polyangiaceae bacterium]
MPWRASWTALCAVLGLVTGCGRGDDAESSGASAFDPSYLDSTADPCTDFFQYACGSWVAQHPVPAGQAQARLFVGDERESNYFWQLLQDMQGTDASLARERSYYGQCLNARRAAAPLNGSLGAQLDLAASLTRSEDLPKVLAGLQLAGGNALFRATTAIDPGDPTQYAFTLSGGGYSLPLPESYADKALAESYRQHIASLSQLAQGSSSASPRLDAEAVFDFERAVAEATSDLRVRRDPVASYQPLPFATLGTALPGFDWPAYLTARSVGTIDQLIVKDAAVLPGLAKLLPDTKVSVLSQYLMWRVLEAHSWATSGPLVREEFAFHGKVIAGRAEPQSDEWICLSATRDVFGYQLAQRYVERFVAPELKPAVSQLVTQIRAAMNDNFSRATWLDDETRARAQDKLTQVVANIAYPEQWPAAPTPALPASEPFLTQVIAFNTDRATRAGLLVGQAAQRDGFANSPDTTNAAYSPEQNAITIPVAILQNPFYRLDRPLSFNLGALGSVVGHELTHAFDDEGRHYDGSGKLDDWWTEAASSEFERRAQCLADQYSSYEVAPGASVDGVLTLGENVADLGGLKLALTVLQATQAGDAKQFFLSYAQLHCSNYSPEALALQVATDPHSPDAFRVNGVVRNLPEFEQAFSCAPGNTLAPVDRCEVW